MPALRRKLVGRRIPAPAANAGKTKRGGRKVQEDIDLTADDADFVAETDDELELMEDASDLGDDHHDMAEVIDNVEKGEE